MGEVSTASHKLVLWTFLKVTNHMESPYDQNCTSALVNITFVVWFVWYRMPCENYVSRAAE